VLVVGGASGISASNCDCSERATVELRGFACVLSAPTLDPGLLEFLSDIQFDTAICSHYDVHGPGCTKPMKTKRK
jgi:hypothetical protein